MTSTVRSLLVLAAAAALMGLAAAGWPVVAGATTTGSSPATPTTTTSGSLPGDLAYFTDSNYYGTSSTVTLSTVRPDGSGARALLRSTKSAYGYPVFSPDGEELAFFTARGTSTGIDVMDLATKKVTSVYRSAAKSAPSAGVAWTSNGDDVVFGSAGRANGSVAKNLALWSVPATGGKATRLTSFDGASDPALSPDGDIVYVVAKESGTGASSVWSMGADGGVAHRVFAAKYLVALPSVSPNGELIAFTREYSSTTANIEVVGTDGKDVRSITRKVNGRYDALATWSPDGTHLAFLSSRSGRFDSDKTNQLYDGYEMTAAGGDVTKVIALSGNKAGLAWLTWGA